MQNNASCLILLFFMTGCQNFPLCKKNDQHSKIIGCSRHGYLFDLFDLSEGFVLTRFPIIHDAEPLQRNIHSEIHSFYKSIALNLIRESESGFISEDELINSVGNEVLGAINRDKVYYEIEGKVYFIAATLFRDGRSFPEYYLYKHKGDSLVLFSVAPEKGGGVVEMDYTLLMVKIDKLSEVVEYIIPPKMVQPGD